MEIVRMARTLLVPLFLVLGLVAAQENGSENTRSCKLKCLNGGVCHIGEGEGQFDFLMRFTAGSSKPLPFLDKNHAEAHDRQHCTCPNGYTGLRCEVELQLCGSEDDHVCFNGAPCKSVRSDIGDEIFYCECSQAGHDNPTSFAGRMCEHASTVYCSWGDFQQRAHSFCTNGGHCIETISPDEKHPGCDCPDGWEGPHCEFEEGTSPKKQVQQNNSSSESTSLDGSWQARAAMFTFMVILVVAILGALVVVVRRIRQDRSKTKSQTPVVTAEAGALEADGSTMPPRGPNGEGDLGDADMGTVECHDGELA